MKKTFKAAVDRTIIARHTEIYNSMLQEFNTGNYTLSSPYLKLNPYSSAPLSLQGGIKTDVPSRVFVTVHGKNGPESDISYNFFQDDLNYFKSHFFPIYGLYADYENKITIQILDIYNQSHENTVTIKTPPLPVDFSKIHLNYPAQRSRLNKNLYYVSHLNSYIAAIDYDAEVRWLFYETYEDLPANFLGGDPMYLLRNGRIMIRHHDEYALGDIDQLGRIYNFMDTDFNLHHDIQELPNGTFLVQAEDPDPAAAFVEDLLHIMDYPSGRILHSIDYKTILDVNRISQPTTPPPNPEQSDWLHANSIDYHAASNVYITSARHQNIVLAADQDTNAIRWILGSHSHWSDEFKPYLLTPVDASGNELYDFSNPNDVISADHDFWNWAQHSAKVYTEDGDEDTVDLFLFDNGCFRSYDSNHWIVPYHNWSRAVHYKINHRLMTVRLVWQFGRDLSQNYYSGYVANVYHIPDTNSIYINSGGTNVNLNTGRNVGIVGDVPMEHFPQEEYYTAPLQEKVRGLEVSLEDSQILFGFDIYRPDLHGVYTGPSFRSIKESLYTAKLYIGV